MIWVDIRVRALLFPAVTTLDFRAVNHRFSGVAVHYTALGKYICFGTCVALFFFSILFPLRECHYWYNFQYKKM